MTTVRDVDGPKRCFSVYPPALLKRVRLCHFVFALYLYKSPQDSSVFGAENKIKDGCFCTVDVAKFVPFRFGSGKILLDLKTENEICVFIDTNSVKNRYTKVLTPIQ